MFDEINLDKISIDNFLSEEIDEAQKKNILMQYVSITYRVINEEKIYSMGSRWSAG